MGKLMLTWAAKREANAEMGSWKGNLMLTRGAGRGS